MQAYAARYRHWQGILPCLQVDLQTPDNKLPQANLVIANLLMEYIGCQRFAAILQQAAPRYLSCIIQQDPENETFVSDSPYLATFDCLEPIHQQITEAEPVQSLDSLSYHCEERTMLP